MSLLIGDNLVVSIHYELTDDDGNVLDSSRDAEPLTYLHGTGNLIPGLESELVGKVAGDTLQVRLEPDKGYGHIVPGLIRTVERAVLQTLEPLEEGMAFQSQAPDGSVQYNVVKELGDKEVTIDGNHPLAGATLNFDINVINVREATDEETAHGHAH